MGTSLPRPTHTRALRVKRISVNIAIRLPQVEMQMTDATVSLRGADLVADLHNVDVLIYKSTRMRLAVGMTFSETASTRRDGTLKKLDALSRERPGAPAPTLTPRQRTRHSSWLSAHFPTALRGTASPDWPS